MPAEMEALPALLLRLSTVGSPGDKGEPIVLDGAGDGGPVRHDLHQPTAKAYRELADKCLVLKQAYERELAAWKGSA